MEMAKEGGKRGGGKKGERRKERGHCDTVAAKRTKRNEGDKTKGTKGIRRANGRGEGKGRQGRTEGTKGMRGGGGTELEYRKGFCNFATP